MKQKIRKNIEVEINETIYADITLTVDEIVAFIEACDNTEKTQIMVALDIPVGIKLNTLDDVLKMEILTELFHKYSQSELNSFL